jgi:hypothetical protein
VLVGSEQLPADEPVLAADRERVWLRSPRRGDPDDGGGLERVRMGTGVHRSGGQDGHGGGRAAAAEIVGESDAGAANLVVGRSPELRRELVDLCETGGPDRVAAREQAAAGVDYRSASVNARPSCRDRLGGFAPWKQSEVLGVDDLGDAEAVVELDDVDVARGDVRRAVRPVGGGAPGTGAYRPGDSRCAAGPRWR